MGVGSSQHPGIHAIPCGSVSARHQPPVGVEGLRSFLAPPGDDYVGIFVNTGGFTKDAQEEARTQEKRRVTLVDPERLFDLWVEHYDKLSDAARRRMRLRPIYFLAPAEWGAVRQISSPITPRAGERRAATMKFILSRKGFDSASGGVASSIMPDGSLLSLPIPDPSGTATFGELRPHGVDLAQVVHDLTRGRLSADTRVHLDPDLEPSSLPRLAGWRPAFGQCEAAQGHLERFNVGVGDLFLFFGWFRKVEYAQGRYQYVVGAPDLQVLFGWLEVGEVLTGSALQSPPDWLRRHPHLDGTYRQGNCVYVARTWGTIAEEGAGTFRQYSSALQLTAAGSEYRSVWRLPAWFMPAGRPPLSYHSNPSRWTPEGTTVLLSTVARGQEFVLDSRDYPEALPWAASLLAEQH